ncbi:D-alanyl-D-alanine carboxypeptidase/D-alanyl-D-alanine-endopeptidase [Pontibacter qinzhouensis]|uniref:D-alanyl-D-alanine carboxypeptidase/D-alanyl-D-alanine-endopeptidase n=1 Tax=Pontibacter qinzhouensis TaxID=2603253 RepID=A0A5C8KDI3_9BACT|nr:D-alanyl-D-alanine carboxypeptidase/D-alanyl-D-alanine-endopeptidase [Pontibacter qinzhouensis]TXK52651.1 D-alanyl-D-alanine carboxypeptidase/D-alanyl-D-alanine-endopeptidase [Pontibacter qinzhouensis]
MISSSAKAAITCLFLLLQTSAFPQKVSERLAAAFKAFQADPQLRNGMASFYVLDASTGQVVYEQNGSVGLAPASTVKVITSATAYELLGKNFRYETSFAIRKGGEGAALVLVPSGDPTLGSWRWSHTKEEAVLTKIAAAMQATGVKVFNEVLVANDGWNEETIPDGWIWQDVGNYYGAGAAKLNWRENQFDVVLRSGKQVGEAVSVVRTVPALHGYTLQSEVRAAAAGTGDKAYIYFPLQAGAATIRGTIPVNQSAFTISGAMPAPAQQLVGALAQKLQLQGVTMPARATIAPTLMMQPATLTTVHKVVSPPLDSLIYWFNRRSINLYGEALLKTIVYKSTGSANPDQGLHLLRNFWKQRGIPETELNMVDGSGLSPLNRVTTHAQVKVLQYARKQPWFSGFYESLPSINGLKMKSGTIRDVKAFCGYHKSKDGKEYIFAFLVNNYNGTQASITQKMYQVLNELK